MCDIVSSFSYGDVNGCVRADFFAVLCPVDELIARISSCRQGDGFALQICTGAFNRATLGGVGGDCNGVGVCCPLSVERSVFSNGVSGEVPLIFATGFLIPAAKGVAGGRGGCGSRDLISAEPMQSLT